MATKLEQAIAAIKAGDKATGKQLLAEVIKTDRNNEQAWLWLIQTDITHEQKIKSLQNVLKINPANEIAKQELAKLQQPAPKKGLLKSPEVASLTPAPITPAGSVSHSQATKTCPYCAETIKADAVVCRFCGRDLKADKETVSQLSGQSSQALDRFIAQKSAQGWQVISRTNDSVQMRKPKQWNRPALVIGLVTIIFGGLGLFILLLAVLDYAFKRDKVAFVTAEQLQLGDRQGAFSEKSNTMQIVVAVLILGVAAYAICYLSFALLGS